MGVATLMFRTMLRLARNAATSAALIGILIAAGPVSASVVIAVDLPELTAEADRIVVGRVVGIEPTRVAGGMIRTRHRMQVEQDLRGSGDREIIVETLGGQIGPLIMRVEGEPSFELGERALVFVRKDGDAVCRPIGMAQGVMRIVREGGRDMVAPNLGGILLVSPNASGWMVKSAGPLPAREDLDSFLSRVREIIETQRSVAR